MSRRCKGCGQRFRPQFGAQRICWDCFRRLSDTTTTTTKEGTMTTAEVVEGELVPDVYTEPPPAPLTLFGTSDPKTALARMSELSKVLVDVVRDRKLAVRISGREHLTCEAWTTLGGMLGVVPIVEWTRPLANGDGWEARVEARTLDGRVVGAAESMCTRSEKEWGPKPTRGKVKDDFALRSMAQTRAIGRALRAPLGQIVVLAGYEPAGAEEMPDDVDAAAAKGSPAAPAEATREQLDEIRGLLDRLTGLDPDSDWKARARELAGVPARALSRGGASLLLDKLRGELAQRQEAA